MIDRDEIAEVVRTVIEVMNGEDIRTRRVLPVHQALTAEWRLMVTFPSGVDIPYDAASEAEALEIAGRFKHSTWQLERRLVGDWAPVPPPPGRSAERPQRRD